MPQPVGVCADSCARTAAAKEIGIVVHFGLHSVLANIADLACLRLRFNAVEARHERQTAVWRHLFPSGLEALPEERHS
jgi:hypothetical protein